MNREDYRELRIKAYVRLDNPEVADAIDVLMQVAEGGWDQEYWEIYEDNFAEWLEELAEERAEVES